MGIINDIFQERIELPNGHIDTLLSQEESKDEPKKDDKEIEQ